ncbi:MAG TPA: Gldg family protein [Bacteroidota bacterium]|nr:Gldg family protein [Bacteroidota bacterium]
MQKQAIFRTILILGILIFVNLLSIKLFTRIDLTGNKMYTLAPASKNLVKSLDDKFLVKAYFTADLPSPYNNNRRYLQDELDEYRAYSGGNFQYEFIDPGTKEDLKTEAQRYGVPPVQVQVLKEDKLQVQEAYMGLVFLYGDKQEKLPVIQNLDNLEYEISSTMKKMTAKDLKKVGFLQGHDEPKLDALGQLKEGLDKQYEVTTVDMTGGKAIPSDIAVLAIVAPDKPFKSWEKYLIDQYIMRGGHVAFLLNKVKMSLQSQQGSAEDINLDDMLESYGVRENTDLVRDERCAMVSVRQQMGMFVMQNQIPFYYLPMASDFSKTSPIVKDLGSVIFYFVSSLDTSFAKPKGLQVNTLITTSKKSGRLENVFYINPTAPATEDMFKESYIPLAVTVEGSFPSAFTNKSVELDSSVAMAIDTTKKMTTGMKSKIVIVGDGDFLQDQYSGGNKDNIIFASNLIDYLADDIGLAAIRSRDTAPRPLEEVTEGTRNWVKMADLGGPPVLIMLFGIFRWRWRSAARKRLESRGL